MQAVRPPLYLETPQDLDFFLIHACPHIGIIMSDEHLFRLGWSFVAEDAGKMLRRTGRRQYIELAGANST